MIYLVDGYNVIFSAGLKSEELSAGRERLYEVAEKYKPHRVIIVFDGKLGVHGEERGPARFTKGETADDYIKRYVREARKPGQIVVVSADRPLLNYVKSFGAKIMSPREFMAGPDRKGGEKSLDPMEAERLKKELLEEWEGG